MAIAGESLCGPCKRNKPSHDDRQYRRNAKIVRREETHCWRCGEFVSPEVASVDHVVPIRDGGSHERHNLRLAHLSCNQMRNNGHATGKRTKPPRGALPR